VRIDLRAIIDDLKARVAALPANTKRAIAAGTLLLGIAALFLWARAETPTAPVPVAAVTPPASIEVAQETPKAEPAPMPASAQIVFNTVPATDALVSWGKKKLGRIAPRQPLTVTRPRDSGPLDVIVTAEGFFPVHTRAHTFSDNKVTVKLTPLDQQATLLGYRVPLDAGVGEDGMPFEPDASYEAPLLTP
jgi:hypothetical protein